MNSRKLKIVVLVLAAVAVVLVVLFASGVIKGPFWTFTVNKAEVPDVDRNLMNGQEAHALALPRASEWQKDAKLARLVSAGGETGPNGRSDNWELLFVSENAKGRGFKITITSRAISGAEEIPYVGVGGELPQNIIPSKEAVAYVHGLKGYENEKVISVDMVYDKNSKKWYWGVKTAKGIVSVPAQKL